MPKKYWHFIHADGPQRLAHRPGIAPCRRTPIACLISEEIAENKTTLKQIINQLADIIAKRAEKKCNFGVALIPEGLIEFVPEMKALIAELNDLLTHEAAACERIENVEERIGFVLGQLGAETREAYACLPKTIQIQLIMDRDPHGNVQVSLVETEKLLIEMVKAELKARAAAGTYTGKFSAQNHFFGYEAAAPPRPTSTPIIATAWATPPPP